MNDLWVTALLVFLAVLFGTISLGLISEAVRDWFRQREVAKRLDPVLSGRARLTARGDIHDLVRAEKGPGGIISVFANRLPGFRGIGTLLEQARVDWSPGTFLIFSFGLALAFGATILTLSRSWALSILAAVAAGFVPYIYAVAARSRRFRQFEEEFPEALDLLTRAIRAGHPLSSGMQMVGDEGPPEVAAEFRRAFEEQRFGIPFDEALLGMVDRTNMVDVRIFAIAVLVQREVGGNLAEILENLAETIRRRFYLRRQLRVYTAQGRMTGYALASLPIFVGIIIALIQPDYIVLLFDNFLGRVLVATALALQLLGGLWIKKIVSIDI
jgi:tight adherence protein B